MRVQRSVPSCECLSICIPYLAVILICVFVLLSRTKNTCNQIRKRYCTLGGRFGTQLTLIRVNRVLYIGVWVLRCTERFIVTTVGRSIQVRIYFFVNVSVYLLSLSTYYLCYFVSDSTELVAAIILLSLSFTTHAVSVIIVLCNKIIKI